MEDQEAADAIINNDVNCLIMFIEENRDRHQFIDFLLSFAANEGQVTCAYVLLKAGADINNTYHTDYTPLMLASKKGHIDMIDYLIQNGADINKKNFAGRSALIDACDYDMIDVVNRLLETGKCDVNITDRVGNNALSFVRGPQILDTLVLHGIDLNTQNKWGQTPLMHLINIGDIILIEKLLSYGADPNIADNNGRTPLGLTNRRRQDIIDLLLDYRAK